MWAALAASIVSGLYGWLAARSTSDEALVLVQVSIVSSLAFVATILTRRQTCQIVALCVVIFLCFFASFVVLVGGRKGLAPNKWSVYDEDDVTVFVSSVAIARSLDRLDVVATTLTPSQWRNASLVIESTTKRTPWYLFASTTLDAAGLERAEDHMHWHPKVDVVDLSRDPFAVYAVRQNAKSTLAGYKVDCDAGVLRCVVAPP